MIRGSIYLIGLDLSATVEVARFNRIRFLRYAIASVEMTAKRGHFEHSREVSSY